MTLVTVGKARTVKNVKAICDACGADTLHNYMVHDDVWAAASLLKNEHAHIWCLESRLKRRLTLEDFTAFPCNDLIRFGFSMKGTNST